MKNRNLYSGVLIIFTSVIALAATPADILKSAWKDPRIEAHNSAVDLAVDAHSYNLIEKFQVIYRDGDSQWSDVKWGIKVYPKGLSEYRSSLRFQSAMEENEKAAHKEALSKLLSERYDLLARMTRVKEEKSISEQLLDVSRRASKALSYAAQNDRNELRSYLKSKTEFEKLSLKIAEMERDYKNMQDELANQSFGTLDEFNPAGMVDISEIRKRVETGLPDPHQQTLSAKTAALSLEKTKAGIAFAKATDSRIVDSIEFVAKDSAAVPGDKSYGFQVAFNIPFFAADDLGRVDQATRELREEARANEVLQTSGRLFSNAMSELTVLLNLHKNFQMQGRQSNGQMKDTSKSLGATDPLLSLEMQREWYESRENMLELEYRIRSLYISVLHEASVIATNPEVNYFSKTMDKLL